MKNDAIHLKNEKKRKGMKSRQKDKRGRSGTKKVKAFFTHNANLPKTSLQAKYNCNLSLSPKPRTHTLPKSYEPIRSWKVSKLHHPHLFISRLSKFHFSSSILISNMFRFRHAIGSIVVAQSLVLTQLSTLITSFNSRVNYASSRMRHKPNF